MSPRDKVMTAVSLFGVLAIFSVLLAGVLGFRYWWPTLWVVGIASLVAPLWIEQQSFAKAFAIVVLILVGALGWAVPLWPEGDSPQQGFSIASFFWAAGVTLWRIAPFGMALAIAAARQRKR